MRANLEDNLATRLRQKSTKWGTMTLAMTGDFVVSASGPTFLFLDPGASTRIVRLPPLEDGMMYLIKNTGSVNSLNVVDFGGSGVITFTTGKGGIVFASQFTWAAVSDASGAQGPQGPPGTAQITGTSTSTQTIGNSGTKSFTVLPVGLGYSPGLRVRAADASAPTLNYMEGVVTLYNSGSGALVFTADNAAGAGTLSSWTINIAGDKGATGASGAGTGDVIGPSSSADNAVARFDTTTGKLIQTSGIILDDSPTATLYPTTDDGGALGKLAQTWSDLFLASGGVINFAAGDVTITHSANALVIAGAANGYSVDAKFFPSANDGSALGDTTHNFSDLFLASGGVLNWNNGDVTATHVSASKSLTLALDAGNTGASTILTVQIDGVTELTLNSTNLSPGANDGNALGVSGTAWSDLFLASGAVINFLAGDYTITHLAGALTLSGTLSIGTTAAFTCGSIELGAASDTTLTRSTAGNLAVEGNVVYRAGGTDVPVSDGGTGASTLTAHSLLVGNGTTAITQITVPALGTVLTGVASADPAFSATPQLGVASLTTGQLKLANSGNTGIITVQYASSATSWTWTYPGAAAGTIGQILYATDTAGALSWAGGTTALGGSTAVGFSANSFSVGSVTGASPTTVPVAANGNFQHLTLNGSSLTGTWTFDVPTTVCSIVVEVVNGGSGAVGAALSTANYTKVTGDTWASTNGNKYLFFVTKSQTYKHLHVQALQ